STTLARHSFPPKSIPSVFATAQSQKLLRHKIVQGYRRQFLPTVLSARDHSSKGPDCSLSNSVRRSSFSKSPGIRNKPYCDRTDQSPAAASSDIDISSRPAANPVCAATDSPTSLRASLHPIASP